MSANLKPQARVVPINYYFLQEEERRIDRASPLLSTIIISVLNVCLWAFIGGVILAIYSSL